MKPQITQITQIFFSFCNSTEVVAFVRVMMYNIKMNTVPCLGIEVLK